ncbi:MAG: hypothetical protein QM718_05130 [Steroidobacteraceae bacterium]
MLWAAALLSALPMSPQGAESAAALPKPPADAHDLSGIWTWMPIGSGAGPGGAPPPRQGVNANDAQSPTGPGGPGGPGSAGGPGAGSGARRPGGGPSGRSSTPPTIKPQYLAQYPAGTLAPNQGALKNDDAAMLCVPDGYFGSGGGYPTAIAQTARQITVINEENHRVRRIYLDRAHPKQLTPSYAGHSIGHWEGNALVVETVGLRGRYGVPNPPGYRIVERYEKTDGGSKLRYTVSFYSDAYQQPGVNTLTFFWRPDLHIQEEVCEEFSGNFDAGYYQ